MLKKILVANRGEIALRIIRACRQLNIKSVAIYTPADKESLPVRLADESICIGPNSPKDSYLNIPAIISAAEISGADAIHPGYGFLAENAKFAEIVHKSGFVFIGPSVDNIKTMADKSIACEVVKNLGIPCLPSYTDELPSNNNKILQIAKSIGYPIMIKASNGGGGRGMRIVNSESDLIEKLNITKHESLQSFSSSKIYLEKYLPLARHIEIQVISDNYQNAIHLFERDCSVQRRHQKVIEEAPAVNISRNDINILGTMCTNACRKLNYSGVGTFEFLYKNGKFYFIEMNTRIQVEHPVTEQLYYVDLIKEQISIAYGNKLKLKQEELRPLGHVIECRITAEDPGSGLPNPGNIYWFHPPTGPGVRVDTHIYSGSYVPPHYDSLLAKIITNGQTRQEAIKRMYIALEETIITGIKTNIPSLKEILKNKNFYFGAVNTNFLENIKETSDNPLTTY